MFADIVFILDYSVSVDSTEWMQGCNFTVDVMNSFTFGPEAVEAAILQFNGPQPYYRYWNTVSNCASERPKKDTDYYSTNDDNRKAAVLAGRTMTEYYMSHGKNKSRTYQTVSSDRASLISTIQTPRTPNGDTCQSYGLDLAIEVLKKSPRYDDNVQAIVIVVTDGADMCPNKTSKSAENIKKSRAEGGVEAFLIEVGVGLECEYDREYLKGLASKINSDDNPAYYDVEDYSKVHQVTEDLFRPLCDEFNSGCSADCRGFCGCGACFCADCIVPEDKCKNAMCNPNNTLSGCVEEDDPCPGPNACASYECNSTAVSKEERCVEHKTDCTNLEEQNPGTCRSVFCSVDEDGCYLTTDDTKCPPKNSCEEWKCGGMGVAATDNTTGCVLIHNQTAVCEEQLSKKLAGCFKLTCHPDDPSDVIDCEDWIEDTCTGTNNCVIVSCELVGDEETGSYQCVTKDRPHEESTPCRPVVCTPGNIDDEGWHVDEGNVKTEEVCKRELFAETGMDESEYEEWLKCKNFFCNNSADTAHDEKLCQLYVRPKCNSQCNQTVEDQCGAAALAKSIASGGRKCYSAQCAVRIKGTTGSESDSEYDSGHSVEDYETYCAEVEEDCYSSAWIARIAEKNLNAKNATCVNQYCIDGQCQEVELEKPEENKCMVAMCAQVGDNWEWKLVPSEANLTCSSDDCYTRVCDPEHGCIRAETLCDTKTACWEQKCENGKCTNSSLLRTKQCKIEKCGVDPDTGVLFTYWEEKENIQDEAICGNPGACVVVGCSDEGTCTYTEAKQPFNDPCSVFSCDNTSGWSVVPLCNDGLYCTKDSCQSGKCIYEELSCTEILEIQERCYVGVCAEDADNNNYLCEAKLVEGASIDVCGKCILESDLTSNLEDAIGDCVDAPEQEIMKEGLAAATIAMIILAAIIIGAAIATSGVMGTKALLDRARAANNQSAHSNPLFEENEAEMTNPAFVGEQ